MTDESRDCKSGESPESNESAPEANSVLNYMLYGLSLPERALRSTSAMVGGALHESAVMLVPNAFKSSKSYTLFVQQMLDFMANDIGGVERGAKEEASTTEVEGYVARKTVSTFIDLAGMATFHLSPMTVLALISDIAYGSQEYLTELSQELKAQGVIDENSTIDNAADLLSAIKNATGASAQAFDLPPLSIEGLAQTIQETRDQVNSVDPGGLMPEAELKRMWNDMHEIATKENVNVMSVASTMSLYSLRKVGNAGIGALSTVKVAGNMFDRHLIQHYREGITTICDRGLYTTLAESSGPYISAVWSNFSSDKDTVTEDLLTGKLAGRAWEGIRCWLGASADETDAEPKSIESHESDESAEGDEKAADDGPSS